MGFIWRYFCRPLLNGQSDLQHVDTGQWRIWHNDGVLYYINMSFNNTSLEIVKKRTLIDLDPRLDYQNMPMRSINFLFVFLDQFKEIDSRCMNWFEPHTVRLIGQCAEYQKDVLVRESPISPNHFDRVTLVAMLLRCLIMSQELADVDGSYSSLCFLDGPGEFEMRPEEDSDYFGLSPSITIKRIDRPRHQRRPRFAPDRPQGLPSILAKSVAIIKQTMFGRQPEEYPGLVYCLCLMSLIAQPLRPLAGFMSPIVRAGDAFYDVIHTLCELYTFCSEDVHPFTEDVDLPAYSRSVDDDQIAVKHFRSLNEMWRDGG
ncbi:MAG: hypothetical protein Q9213_002126 [Squamulea squamosa]